MASIGSYVLSIKERGSEGKIDKKTACTRVLKLLGARLTISRDAPPVSQDTLLSETGIPADLLREALEQLRQDGLAVKVDDGWALTDLGYKAHFIVAT